MNLMQMLTEELTDATKRAQALQQIVDELFTIAAPGTVKNALWARYQGIEGASPEPAMFKPMYTLEDLRDLALDDETEPSMYHCKYCGNYHMVAAKEYYCPLDPNRPTS
jgi:hypothetical protein